MKKLLISFICLEILLLLLPAGIFARLPQPKIKQGIMKLNGRISGLPKNRDTAIVRLSVPNPVTGEVVTERKTLDDNGSFSFSIPVETDYAMCILSENVLSYLKA